MQEEVYPDFNITIKSWQQQFAEQDYMVCGYCDQRALGTLTCVQKAMCYDRESTTGT